MIVDIQADMMLSIILNKLFMGQKGFHHEKEMIGLSDNFAAISSCFRHQVSVQVRN